jgi:hypothetical protein
MPVNMKSILSSGKYHSMKLWRSSVARACATTLIHEMFAFSQSSGSIPVSINLWKLDVTAGGIWHVTFGITLNITFHIFLAVIINSILNML